MKKFLLLIVVFGFIFTGCSNSNSKNESTKIVRGEWSGDTFTSYVGEFKFTKPSSWYVLSDEEIAQTMGIGYEQMKEEWGLNYSLEDMDDLLLYDMMVVDMATGSSVNVIYESIEGSYSEKTYLELAKSTYSTMNYGDIFELKIGGEKYYAMQAALNGYTATTIIKINNGIACCITVGSVDGGASFEDIISYFS